MKKLMMAACAGLLLFAFTAEANPGKGKGKGHAYAYGLQKNQDKHLAKQQAKMYKEQQKAARKQQNEWNKANGGDDDYRYGKSERFEKNGGTQPNNTDWSLGDIFNGL
jgi:hypothetical protein